MEYFNCSKGCCLLKTTPYNHNIIKISGRTERRKAGAFIYDPITNKVLLVQSRGNLWGPPKGTLDTGESEQECAIREVKEETGLDIAEDEFIKATIVRNKALYFYIERNLCNVEVQNHIKNNDVNALGWITPECLEQCIIDGRISLTHHCRVIFYRFMGLTFSDTLNKVF